MQTSITESFLATSVGREAEQILRSCVHCGFCTATCPTYQLLGDELDGPRGRVYLIKQLLEGEKVTHVTQQHLDRCLSCRSCETTCPSGVQYSKLVDMGRELVEQQVTRPKLEQLSRFLLRKLLPYSGHFSFFIRLGQTFQAVLPNRLRQKVPPRQIKTIRPTKLHKRKMILLEGCAQSSMTPQTNDATSRILHRLGISLAATPNQGCCGAISQHLSASQEAKRFMQKNIDAWWPAIEEGAEAIISTASGCGLQIKDYAYLLREDKNYAEKAKKVSSLTRDLSEIIAMENLDTLKINNNQRIAFHSPCSLQHGQQLNGQVESILKSLGFTLTEVSDSHLCCGSSGTYSILEADISNKLLNNKLNALNAEQPDKIVTANVGCQLHLSSKSKHPVQHWIELLDQDA